MLIKLPNGYEVEFYGGYDDGIIELINPKGYTITGRPLTEEEKKKLSEKFSD